MALPVILINSATGSDTAASGAGPTTALTGSAASTSADGLTVTLDGSPDLTNVQTDGSHVLFLSDATAGARNFGQIVGKANSGTPTAQVTIRAGQAFRTSAAGLAWALGGKRATLGGTTSKKLCDNNGAAGDAMPGWQIKLESSHAETLGATFDLRRSGDNADGPIILCGASGAATLPLLTFSNNGVALSLRGQYLQLQDFELRNNNATKTASVAIQGNSGVADALIRRVKINHTSDSFWKGLVTGFSGIQVAGCDIGYCANVGIDSSQVITINLCRIHHCGSHGIAFSGGSSGVRQVIGNEITNNGGDGLNYGATSTAAHNSIIAQNTFANNTGDGVEFTAAGSNGQFRGLWLVNNISSHNGGYGFNFSGAAATELAAQALTLDGNQTYANTSGATNPGTLPVFTGNLGLDPQYTDAANGDYRIGTNLRGAGAPTSYVGTYGPTRSYVDPGAAQRQEQGGGLRLAVGFTGGFRG